MVNFRQGWNGQTVRSMYSKKAVIQMQLPESGRAWLIKHDDGRFCVLLLTSIMLTSLSLKGSPLSLLMSCVTPMMFFSLLWMGMHRTLLMRFPLVSKNCAQHKEHTARSSSQLVNRSDSKQTKRITVPLTVAFKSKQFYQRIPATIDCITHENRAKWRKHGEKQNKNKNKNETGQN